MEIEMDTHTPTLQNRKLEEDMFEINGAMDQHEKDPVGDNVLVKVKIDPDESKKIVRYNEYPIIKKLKNILLFRVFGYKGTLVHVMALYFLLLSIISALIGSTMDICIDQIFQLRKWLLGLYDARWFKILIWMLFTMIGSTLAFLVTKYISPAAGGSGVSEVKVTILGVNIPGLLTFRTLVAKVVGLIIAIGSGLWCGKVGPFIHIASCVAANLTHLPCFKFLRKSNDLFVQMIAIAAGCGVSSNFGTIIGGLLFSVEVTAAYYPVRNYWFATFTSVISGLVFRTITNLYRHNYDTLFLGLLNIKYTFPAIRYREIGIGLLMGVICSFFAIFFVKFVSTIFNTKLYLRIYKLGRIPYFYLFLVALFTAVVTSPWGNISPLGLSTNQTLAVLFDNKSLVNTFGEHYLIALVICFFARFTITSLSVSLPVPVGLFATNIVVGSILGRFVGEVFETWGWENSLGPSGFALMGGACYVASLTQTFSAAIVVSELVDNVQLMIPLLIGTIFAISIARLFSYGVYDQVTIDKKLPYIPDIQYSTPQSAEMVMDTDMIPVPECTNIMELQKIVDGLKTVVERSLPVVDTRDGRVLLGQIKLSEIRRILTVTLPESVAGKFMLDYKECPLVVLRHTPLSEVYMLFVAAQVDSAFVTHNGRLMGEINKKCLNQAIEKQMNILF
ncbi:chloride channel type clc, putative [Entamoeba invadens IP1]|uniref:Chloride channel type clc, putative n=1 Tax=Entamoeba invadens IP1 TaxID=370355 RepID=L7FLS6_ENTIV|nr:chloride channel type clc, putative [Entamoeba invadens IP1]ELP84823.1 chloride channel type clc, putative [Entamoeba invadens IP1]|eukprot:XP_004184169.1 chloride channel type clc, putative [Entamoeba invadens IP1]